MTDRRVTDWNDALAGRPVSADADPALVRDAQLLRAAVLDEAVAAPDDSRLEAIAATALARADAAAGSAPSNVVELAARAKARPIPRWRQLPIGMAAAVLVAVGVGTSLLLAPPGPPDINERSGSEEKQQLIAAVPDPEQASAQAAAVLERFGISARREKKAGVWTVSGDIPAGSEAGVTDALDRPEFRGLKAGPVELVFRLR